MGSHREGNQSSSFPEEMFTCLCRADGILEQVDSPVKRSARTVTREAWHELSLLQKALAEYGLHSIFVKLDHLEPVDIAEEMRRASAS